MKGKNIHPEDSSLAYLSGGVHLACILVIVLMSYKYRQLKNKKEGRENQDKGTTTSLTNTGQSPERQELGVNGPSKDSRNGTEERQRHSGAKLSGSFDSMRRESVDKLASHEKETKRAEEEGYALMNLKAQLALEQERSRYLQEELKRGEHQQNTLKDELKTAKDKIAEVQLSVKMETAIRSQAKDEAGLVNVLSSEEMSDLRCELQFCQKLLSQRDETLKDTKAQLAVYQRVGERTLSHPEFIRLREKNRGYKETILKLQRGLLEGRADHVGNIIQNYSFSSD